jgi:hypothetical protein
MYEIQFPSLTQFSVSGAYDPRIADPSTNNGNRDVSLDRTRSRPIGDVEEEDEGEDEEDDSSFEDGDVAHEIITP